MSWFLDRPCSKLIVRFFAEDRKQLRLRQWRDTGYKPALQSTEHARNILPSLHCSAVVDQREFVAIGQVLDRRRFEFLIVQQGIVMDLSDKTAREMYEQIKINPPRARKGFGLRAGLINIDMQRAYTQLGTYITAYETDPKQIEYVNELSALCRRAGFPVVWTYVAYLTTGADACAWGTRSNTPDSVQNIKEGSDRAKLDERLKIDRDRDLVINKRMASGFHETPVNSFFTFHNVDTVIVTGGSTSGCVRATVVDVVAHGYWPIVPEECVADKHESPHFANLYDMAIKYADVMPVSEVIDWLRQHPEAKP